MKNYQAYKFKGAIDVYLVCKLRRDCLRYPERTEIRQLAYLTGKSRTGHERFTEIIKRKIDTTVGRTIYGMRLAVGEPPFAHMRSTIGLDRFSLQGKKKVNIEWNQFCMVHNLKKVHAFGTGSV